MIIEGKNAIVQMLENMPKDINNIIIKKNISPDWIEKIKSLSSRHDIEVSFLDKEEFNNKYGTSNQGAVAYIKEFNYTEQKYLDEKISDKDNVLILILDGVEDPQNLGSIIRSAAAFGCDGIVIPKRRACQITSTVFKTSAGTVINLPIIRVSNINNYINKIKQDGVFCFGLDANGDSIYNANLKGKTALVIGNEGKGISELTKKLCDSIVSIPMNKKVDSLNAGVAAGISIYEVLRQR